MDKNAFQLKMQSKQLENEAKRIQKEATKERNKAKAALKKGNRAAAQLYAQNAVRYDQQAAQLLQSASTTTGYATDLRQAQVTKQMAQNMTIATNGLAQNVKAVDLNKVSAQRTKLDGLKEKMGAAHELLAGEGEMDLQAGADDLLAALEQENQEDALMQLNDIPQGLPAVPAQNDPTGVKF